MNYVTRGSRAQLRVLLGCFSVIFLESKAIGTVRSLLPGQSQCLPAEKLSWQEQEFVPNHYVMLSFFFFHPIIRKKTTW